MKLVLVGIMAVLVLGAVIQTAIAGGINNDTFISTRDSFFTFRGDLTLNLPPRVDPAMSSITIPLIGDPPTLPGPDTIVTRGPTPIPPLSGSEVVPIEIVELQLVSVAPFTVPTTGDQWDVKIELDLPPFPQGIMTITKTHANGGEFSASVPVTPKFTFTKVSDSTVVPEVFELELFTEDHLWNHFPCPNSFLPVDPMVWAVQGINQQDGIVGTLFQNPLSEDRCVVGGQSMPIDSSSLVLAGAQSYSWMLPVALSILGIGLFIVSRKSDNSFD